MRHVPKALYVDPHGHKPAAASSNPSFMTASAKVQLPVGSTPPTTPRKGKRQTARASTPGGESSPKQQRRCVHCGKPRVGHARSGCPNVDPPIPPASTSPRASPRSKSVGESISVLQPAFHTMTLEDTVDEETVTETQSAEPVPKTGSSPPLSSASPTSGGRAIFQPKALQRTQSMLERQTCVGEMMEAHPMCLCLPVHEIAPRETAIRKVRMHTRVLMPGSNWKDKETGILVFGRNSEDVDQFFKRITDEADRGRLAGQLALSAVAGAGIAWTALAFA
ncbi:hypothetical protein A0H81_09682 [Grifola frondosa]|uniref:Uncharacterized protein n=1 Tax=Grifola frondosa TaxID=5627 RepID=A0A1C7M295_GRIFR|nr:hypothetical protein A0H81_09682 [Grifola frondosa]